MKNFIPNFVGFIGLLLISLADAIIIMRKGFMTILFFATIFGLVLGTILSFFELFTGGGLLWGNFYYALIAFGIGITTIVLGLVKMFKAGV